MAHITIPDTTPRIVYAVGATPTTEFPVPFAFFDPAIDIRVYIDGAAATYTVTPTTTAEFSVTLIGAVDDGYSAGTVVLGAAVSNVQLVIERDLPVKRVDDFVYPSPTLNIRALNKALDYITACIQERERDLARAVRLATNDSAADTVLPLKADRLNLLMGFDSEGNVTVYTPASLPAGFTPGGAGGITTTVEAELRRWVWPEQYGAVRDGVNPDSEEIALAIDSLDAGGGLINFAPGTYNLETGYITLEHALTLRGAGMNQTDLDNDPDPRGTRFEFTGTGGAIRTNGAARVRGARLESFLVKGDSKQAGSIGIDASFLDGSMISHVTVWDMETGVKRDGAIGGYRNLWLHPEIVTCDYGFVYQNGANADVIIGARISECTEVGFLWGEDAADTTNHGLLIGNSMEANGVAIVALGKKLEVIGCGMEGSRIERYRLGPAAQEIRISGTDINATLGQRTAISGKFHVIRDFPRDYPRGVNLLPNGDCENWNIGGTVMLLLDGVSFTQAREDTLVYEGAYAAEITATNTTANAYLPYTIPPGKRNGQAAYAVTLALAQPASNASAFCYLRAQPMDAGGTQQGGTQDESGFGLSNGRCDVLFAGPIQANAAGDYIQGISPRTHCTGRKVQLTSSGTLPAGLALATDYFIRRILPGSATVTVDASTDVVTASADLALFTDCPVWIEGATMPGGYTEGRVMFARDVSALTFKLAEAPGAAAFDFSTNGSGTLTAYVARAQLAETEAEAFDGSAIVDITDAGTGTHTSTVQGWVLDTLLVTPNADATEIRVGCSPDPAAGTAAIVMDALLVAPYGEMPEEWTPPAAVQQWKIVAHTATIDFASMAAGVTAAAGVSVPGIGSNYFAFVTNTASAAGYVTQIARSGTPDLISVRAYNTSGGGLDPSSQTYDLLIFVPV